MKYVLGLTGPTGSGKSTLCKAAKEMGWYVIDCDALSREATENSAVLKKLADVFGNDILDKNGKLVRSALAQKAFSSKENTNLLNKTILPYIVELIKQRINESGSDKIILDAPTLYESGADSLCDAVCAILSNKKTRLARIMSRDGIDKEEALLRISAGKPDRYYRERTPRIICNNADEQGAVETFKNLLIKLGGN